MLDQPMTGSIASPLISNRLRPMANPRKLALAFGVLTLVAATAISAKWNEKTLLVNGTPSEPIGIFGRVKLAPQVGQLIAFKAPAGAFPYADRRLGYLHRIPMLKTIAGVAGDQICTVTGRLVINGHDLAPIIAADQEGRALPHWTRCRVLRRGEVFVFSARVPNSFDSRYFGPVPTASIRGVYAPLLTLGKAR
jgi:conjugative transfer signal peptidase TraF